MSLPNLFILGGQKCATTSLADVLMQHKELSFCKLKEPFFLCYDDEEVLSEAKSSPYSMAHDLSWDKNKNELMDLYENLFSSESSAQWVVDATTLYLPSTRVPERIKDFSPNAKFVVLLREPLRRSKSAYHHYAQRLFKLPAPEGLSLKNDPLGILRFSCYERQLENWFQYFGKDHFFIATFEEFVTQPEDILDRLRIFLNLKTPILWDEKKSNVTSYPRFERETINTILDFFEKLGLRLAPKQYCELNHLKCIGKSTDSGLKEAKRPLKRKLLEFFLMKRGLPHEKNIIPEATWESLLGEHNKGLIELIPEAKLDAWWKPKKK